MKEPIAIAKGIGPLVRFLSKRPAGKGLNIVKKTKSHEEHLVMAAPATVAWCMNDCGISKKKDGELRILVINARMIDYLDDGQWYRFVAGMLDSNAEIQVIANTLDASLQKASVVPMALKKTNAIRTDIRHEAIDQTIRVFGADYFDVAICFGQIHGSRAEDLGSHGMKALVQAGVPVYLADYSRVVGTLNRHAMKRYGIESELITENNKYEMVSAVRGERWAGTISRLTSVSDNQKVANNLEMSALVVTAKMVLHSKQSGFPEQPNCGVKMPSPHEDIVCFMDELGVGRDWRIYNLQYNSVEPVGRISDEWIEYVEECDDAWSEGEKLVWAAHVKYFWLATQAKKAA